MQNIKSKVVFKDYNHKQILLLPPSLEELIEDNHPVRLVDTIIDNINLDIILSRYPGGGRSSYHPRLMLKILVYSYLCNYYSSRRIEQALRQNIHFMWLSGMSYPDHNTINRFRSDRLKGVLKEIFSQVVHMLIDCRKVSMKEVFVDGTKLEANANRYTFVWAKTVKYQKNKIAKQLEELWTYTQQLAKDELDKCETINFEEIDSGKLRKTIDNIDRALAGKNIDIRIKKKLAYGKKKWPETLEKYEQHESNLKGRNSFSKTDPDATFMRTKDDHMQNGQLKPCYNLQLSTQDQFILNYTLHPDLSDTSTLPDHIESLEQTTGKSPKALVADSGYGSEQNYDLLEEKEIEPYVKYNYFHKEKSKKWREDPFKTQNLFYNSELDCYYCPMSQAMTFIGEKKTTTDNGFEQTKRSYQAQNCKRCPLRSSCFRGKGNRTIEVNPNLLRHRAKARELLDSEQGIEYRKRRCVDVEGVFGMIKQNRHFRRFMLRGNQKVILEVGLLAIAHNIKKMAV